MRMALIGAIALGLLTHGTPASAHERHFTVTSGSEVAYHVRARLLSLFPEEIEGRNQQVRGAIDVSEAGMPTGWIEAANHGFRSGIRSRDSHVYQILGGDEHPSVRFELQRVEEFDPTKDEGLAIAVGTLWAHGRALRLRVPLTFRLHEGALELSGQVPVHFTDFGIAPPVLGLVLKRAPDDLTLKFHLLATEVERAN